METFFGFFLQRRLWVNSPVAATGFRREIEPGVHHPHTGFFYFIVHAAAVSPTTTAKPLLIAAFREATFPAFNRKPQILPRPDRLGPGSIPGILRSLESPS